MPTIDLKALGKNVVLAVQFLGSRLDEPLKARGSLLQLRTVNDHTAKLLLYKFLRQAKLEKKYRVVVVRPGSVQIVEPVVKKKVPMRRERKGAYAVPMTIPQYQVAAEMGGRVPRPGERKWKP